MMFTTSRLDAFASAPDALFIHVTLLSDTESLPSIPHTSYQPHAFTPIYFKIFVKSEGLRIGKLVVLNEKEYVVINCILEEPYSPNLHVHLNS
jgi:hypothetical protein